MARHRRESLAVLAARLDAMEKLIDERRKHDEAALKLQAKEYERRLDHLNHAQHEADRRNANYISREVYESEIGALRKLVYIGVGVIITIQGALWWIVQSATP